MKKKISISNLIYNLVIALAVAFVMGFNPITAIVASLAVGTILSFVKLPKRALFAGVAKEIWTDVLMKNFIPDISFLGRSRDFSSLVEYNTINLADIGVSPNVLVNNTSYPIPVHQRTDTPLALPLSVLDTENTLVRNTEEIEASYDKMESVLQQHREALLTKAGTLAAYNYAPQAANAFNYVLQATGAGGALTFADVLRLSAAYDAANVPKTGRVLVLSPKHLGDLEAEDLEKYRAVFGNTTYNMFGFTVFVFSENPTYTTAGVKNPYGSIDGQVASFSYTDTEVMRAIGDIEMFADLNNPYERGDIVGFQLRFAGLSIRNKYSGAIYSPEA